MHRALIIEDEETSRADLRAKLGAHPDVTVVGEAATVRNARAIFARADYDLVFLDIQLVGGNAFDLVPEVRPEARIVFVTAYDDYAVRAFEINALDYLLKPVAPARLAEALRRLSAPAPPEGEAGAEPPLGPGLGTDDILCLRAGLKVRFAPVSDISVVAASGNYSEVQLADGTRVFMRKTLQAWEDALPASHFMRVHRGQIVNLSRVLRYERDADEHTRLYLAGAPGPVPASRERWTDLRERLAAVGRPP